MFCSAQLEQMEHTYTYTQTLQFLEKSVFVIVLSLKIEDHSNVGRAEQRVNRPIPQVIRSLGFGCWGAQGNPLQS